MSCLVHLQQLKENAENHSDWEKQRRQLLQESPEEELKLVKRAKEEAEGRVVNLERELTAKHERIMELEKKIVRSSTET